MAKLIMRRTAADNQYLHRDFHGALSTGLEFVHDRYGPEAVREYLHRFARAYYAPLTAAIKERGLDALAEHLASVYRTEGGKISLTVGEDELLVHVAACPALGHMRAQGYPVARLWGETSRTVYQAICEGTPFEVEVQEYDPQTGRTIVRFRRRPA